MNDENQILLENYIKNYNIKEDFFSILHENVYDVKDLNKIDNAFNEIIDKCAIIEEDRTGKKYTFKNPEILDKNLSIIEKTIKKIFNIELNIKIDVKTPKLKYFACIYITDEDIENVKNDIKEIIEDEKFGLHYLKVKKADILFQVHSFFYVKDFNSERKLNGRHLTSILLHEIGHKIYLKLAYNKNAKGDYLLSINDSKEVGFKIYGKKDKNTKKKLNEIVACSILIVLSWLAMTITSYVSSIFNTKEYTRVESYSDRLAIQYGYGKEIYQFFLTIELWSKGKLTTNKSFFLTKLLDADYIRRKEMKSNIVKEINNGNNTKEQIKMLKEILKFIEEIEKDAEKGNYRYNFNK